ncbi:MAG: hypothetical protein H6R07_3156 [Proteobacteria bacterium]|nr:hypothetical protein [Pseudomonadota bacterium]
MNSVRRRLIVFFVIVVTSVLGASGAYSYWRSRTELANDLKHTGDALRSRLETSLPGPLWNFDDYQLDRILDSEMLSPKIRQIVIENSGKLVAGRGLTSQGQIERLNALPEKKAGDIEFNVFYQDNFQRPIGKVIFRLSEDPMNEQLNKIVLEKLIEIALLVSVIVLALSRSLTVLLVRPLRQLHDMLQRAADQTEEGISDAALRLPDCHYVEFADVTSGYNRIARRLLEDLHKRRAAEDEMRQSKDAAETAYRQLKETQTTLVQSEKMASLGSLVAGIAHEINTPIGVILTGASVLSEESSAFQKGVEAGTMKKSEVLRYTETAMQSASLIQANAVRAAALIQSFKQVAVDQTSEARRVFELGEYIEEIVLSLRPAFKHSAIEMKIDCPEKIEVDGYPGALSQVITNMVTNSLHHAFEPGQPGTMSISASMEHGAVKIIFSDNGRGILPENMHRIFDPFFTTQRGSGGSGLGLHIVYNLVTQTMGGTIAVTSSPGNGATFTIAFPRLAPDRRNHASTDTSSR